MMNTKKPPVALAVTILATAFPAAAATLVTGAGPDQGITLVSSDVIYALNISGLPTPAYVGPFQGVTFQTAYPEITVASGGWGVFGNANTQFNGGNAEEQALDSLAKELFFSATDGSLKITGLIAGDSYKLDILQTIGPYTSRNQNILVNGVTLDSVVLTQNSGQLWNSSLTGIADANGEILLGFDGTSGDGPVFSSLMVSVPEPSGLLLGALGLLPLCRRRR